MVKTKKYTIGLKNILNSIPLGIVLLGLHGFILEWNKKASELFDKKEEDAIGTSLAELFSDTEKDRLNKFITKSLQSKKQINPDIFEREIKGRKQYLEVSSSRVSKDLENTGAMITLKDITKNVLANENHKKVEKMLIKSEQKFHHIFNVAVSSVIILDRKGNFADVNPAACRLFSLAREKLIGKKIVSFLDEDFKNKMNKIFKEAIRTRKQQKGQMKLNLPRGRFKDIEYSFVPYFIDDNHLYILRDITDINMEKKRQEYYLGILGHELKTPLAGIKAYAQITQRRIRVGDNRKVDYYLSRIDSQVDKLTKFVNELLDITRIRAGKLTIIEEVFKFDELLKETVENIEQTIQGYKITVDAGADRNIIADRSRMGEVITNLISNAVKYSPDSNKILIKSVFSENIITLSVQDFGIGIPEEKRSKIFEPFFRASDLNEEKFSGLGLGLYISSEIIKLHGGKMWLESEMGKGSVFYFSIPIKRSKNKSSTPQKD